MGKFKFLLPLLTALTLFASCDVLQKAAADMLLEATVEEISQALKDALGIGIGKGVNVLSAKDGYLKSIYKIGLPSEAKVVTDQLRVIPGFTNLEADLIEKVNHGAEDAAKEAGSIFLSAIKKMTFTDAKNILMGKDNAATDFLHRATYQELFQRYNPKINAALDKYEARSIWKKATDTYNAIPLVSKKVNTDLGAAITEQALNGLFKKVEEEEKNIRRNVSARPTDLLRKVFAQQDSNRK